MKKVETPKIKEWQQGALEDPKDEWKELKTWQCIHTYKETTWLKQQNEKKNISWDLAEKSRGCQKILSHHCRD